MACCTFDLEQRESELLNVEDRIERTESRLDDRKTLEADRRAVSDRLQGLRGRIDHIGEEAIERFNKYTVEVLGTLDYQNLEHIWFDRKTGSETCRLSDPTPTRRSTRTPLTTSPRANGKLLDSCSPWPTTFHTTSMRRSPS
jgi:hypothetical protein